MKNSSIEPSCVRVAPGSDGTHIKMSTANYLTARTRLNGLQRMAETLVMFGEISIARNLLNPAA